MVDLLEAGLGLGLGLDFGLGSGPSGFRLVGRERRERVARGSGLSGLGYVRGTMNL